MNIFRYIRDEVSDLFSPMLSDRKIMKYNKKGLLVEQLIPQEQLQPNSVDLTLGLTYKQLLSNCVIPGEETAAIDPKFPILFNEGTFPKHLRTDNPQVCIDNCRECRLKECYHPQYYILRPKEFILMASNEILNIPNGIVGFVQGRSSIARLAIQTEQAGLIDAGFRGTVTLELFNQSTYPIFLYPGMRVAHVHFLKAQRALIPYGAASRDSKYKDQIRATESRIHMDK